MNRSDRNVHQQTIYRAIYARWYHTCKWGLPNSLCMLSDLSPAKRTRNHQSTKSLCMMLAMSVSYVCHKSLPFILRLLIKPTLFELCLSPREHTAKWVWSQPARFGFSLLPRRRRSLLVDESELTPYIACYIMPGITYLQSHYLRT